MLHLTMSECIKRNRKIGVLFIDLECQFSITINHVKECFRMYKNYIEKHWVCVPLKLRNSVSVYEPNWICWDENKKWIREKENQSTYPFHEHAMEFEDFTHQFGQWYSNGEKTACLVGIRTDESVNRYMAIHKKTNSPNFITNISSSVDNIYPIHDWKFSDIWLYHYQSKKPYNKLYDLMFSAGVKNRNMRICQPFGDEQKKGLYLYHIIEPDTWVKLIGRVGAAKYGEQYEQNNNILNGGKLIKPKNLTWKEYSNSLLIGMPEKTRLNYQYKISKFLKKWRGRGYAKGIPDEADLIMENRNKAPSYRRICKAILKNDYNCLTLGFSSPRTAEYGEVLKNKNKLKVI